MRKTLTIGAAMLVLAGCMHKGGSAPASAAKGGAPSASARLESRSDSHVTGTAFFSQKDGEIQLVLEVSGLTPGEHAFHIHEKGDCSAPDAASAGGHWNPTTENHGKWRVTGSSSCNAPASRSWRIDVAVKSLVMEAMR